MEHSRRLVLNQSDWGGGTSLEQMNHKNVEFGGGMAHFTGFKHAPQVCFEHWTNPCLDQTNGSTPCHHVQVRTGGNLQNWGPDGTSPAISWLEGSYWVSLGTQASSYGPQPQGASRMTRRPLRGHPLIPDPNRGAGSTNTPAPPPLLISTNKWKSKRQLSVCEVGARS